MGSPRRGSAHRSPYMYGNPWMQVRLPRPCTRTALVPIIRLKKALAPPIAWAPWELGRLQKVNWVHTLWLCPGQGTACLWQKHLEALVSGAHYGSLRVTN